VWLLAFGDLLAQRRRVVIPAPNVLGRVGPPAHKALVHSEAVVAAVWHASSPVASDRVSICIVCCAVRVRLASAWPLPSSGPFATASNIFAIAERAEARGFDDVWVNDHYSYPRSRLTMSSAGSIEAVSGQVPNFFESLTTLAAVAGRCGRSALPCTG
jgi:hypothetical protein